MIQHCRKTLHSQSKEIAYSDPKGTLEKIITLICLAQFLKTYLKTWPEKFALELGDSQVSGHCGEKKHRGLAVLVGLIVKLSP